MTRFDHAVLVLASLFGVVTAFLVVTLAEIALPWVMPIGLAVFAVTFWLLNLTRPKW